jgi:hypothetical protein
MCSTLKSIYFLWEKSGQIARIHSGPPRHHLPALLRLGALGRWSAFGPSALAPPPPWLHLPQPAVRCFFWVLGVFFWVLEAPTSATKTLETRQKQPPYHEWCFAFFL